MNTSHDATGIPAETGRITLCCPCGRGMGGPSTPSDGRLIPSIRKPRVAFLRTVVSCFLWPLLLATTAKGAKGQFNPPTDLEAVASGDSAIDLSWETPESSGGFNPQAQGYRIEVSSDGGETWSVLVANTDTTATSYRHGGLVPATTRHYQVRAFYGLGTFSAPSNVASATTEGDTGVGVPGAPELEAKADGETAIELQWGVPEDTGSSAITGYRVEVSSDEGESWSVLVVTTDDAEGYIHRGLEPGTTRHYRVRAINSAGAGPASKLAIATTEGDPVGGAPGAPELEATADGETAIELEWTAPEDTGSSAITGYSIDVSSDGGATWIVLFSNTGSVETYTHRGLEPGTTRHYRVRAINSAGAGPPSNVASATTEGDPVGGVPGAPVLEATADGETAIELEWAAPEDTGSSAITGYRIEVSSDGGATWIVLFSNTGSAEDVSYIHRGLEPGTTRHYRVRAINSAGAGPPSNVASATTEGDPGEEEGIPGAPTNLSATAVGNTAIGLSWTAPTETGGSAIAGYRIEVSGDGGLAWGVLVAHTGSAGTSYTHTGLAAASTRHYRVSAINAAGRRGPASNVAHATTGGGAAGAPSGLKAEAQGASAIALSWFGPEDDGGSPVEGYRIRVSADGGRGWSTLVDHTGSAGTTYTHGHLASGSTRHYRVAAINGVGVGPESDTAGATTDAVVPGTPRNLSAVARGSSRIDLEWELPADTGGAPVTGYRIEVYDDGGSLWEVLESDTRSPVTSYHHLGLPPGSTRRYRVSAINGVGMGGTSDVAVATTDPVVPDRPLGLAATAEGSYRIGLAWQAPEYDGGAPVTGYRIEVFDGGTSPWKVLEDDTRSAATEYAHAGVGPGSTWHYRVSAINAAGVGRPSTMAEATADPVVPDAPTGLAATESGTSRIDLAWTAPGYDGGARITGYRIETSEDAGATWTILVDDTRFSGTAFPHTGLVPGSTWHYRVSAINRAGAGEPSEVAFATTDATVPEPPARLGAAARDHARIDLAWGAPDFDGGARITGYRIEVSEDAGANWRDLAANTGTAATEYLHGGLRPASTRHYRVSAINEIGVGHPSNVAHATTDAVAPDPPTHLVAAATEPTRIELSWRAPEYDGGASVTSYRIEVSPDGTAWSDLERSTGVAQTSYAHTGLKPGSTWYYRVSAINEAGTGLPSGVAWATTDDPVARAARVHEAVLPHFAAAMATSTLSAISGRIEAVAARNPLATQLQAAGLMSLAGGAAAAGPEQGLTVGRLLDGASFVLPHGGASGGRQEDAGSGTATWGGAEYLRMGEPAGEQVRWEGDMLNLHAGFDTRPHRDFLLGLAGSRAAGNYDFTDMSGAREVDGTYEARMTSVSPYLAWLPGRTGVAAWAAGVFGWGQVAVDDELAGRRPSDVRMTTGAIGGNRLLLSSGTASLRLRGEGWMSRVEVDGAEGVDPLMIEMRRVRFALSWSQTHRLEAGHAVALMLEGAMRHGDGDGTDGTGFEAGGRLRYASASEAVTVEGYGRMLVKSSSDYEEWGIGGLVRIDPQPAGRGLSLKIAPSWGKTASGVQALWERGVTHPPAESHTMAPGRLIAEMEYGAATLHATPYGRFSMAGGGTRTAVTGVRYDITRVLGMRLEATRTANTHGDARHQLAMKGLWRF